MSGGGVETPRQKMIGMMYLFYTALLALQVDTAILEKFILINKTLEHQIIEIDLANNKLYNGIQGSVEDKGNRPDDKRWLDKATKVRQETQAIIKEINATKAAMIVDTGGFDENGGLVGQKDQDAFSTHMITNGNGKKLKARLNAYSDMLGEETGKPMEFPAIAKDAREYDEFKNNPNQNLKGFGELFFLNTPVGAGLSSMSQLQSEVLQYETKALKLLGEQVGIKDVDFDQVFPLIRPESRIVPVGGTYKAEMFIAGSSSAFVPEMAVDGVDIPIDTMQLGPATVKYGRVEFRVTGGGRSIPGTMFKEKSFVAAITMMDSTYIDTVFYQTITPTMTISSRALSALWRNCANELSVQVPALGNDYNPQISATNADRIMSGGRGDVTIIPNSNRSVTMTVKNAGLTIGTQNFRVKEIPPPNYSFKLGNSEIDKEKGIAASALRGNLTVAALAEKNFADDVPKDARYRVEDVQIFLKSGSDPRVTDQVNSGRVSLRKIAGARPRKGEYLVIKINRVSRINFKGERERISVRGQVYTIPIN